MSKAKLTLYIDKEINKMAKKSAILSGKSISAMVKEYFIATDRRIKNIKIPKSISRWIGVLDNDKSYKELRDDYIDERLKKYENID